ncbi:MAG: pyruvate, phosphate dikinase [Roseiarcus sp.]|jgi:pyruvate,orthophosphate dikinase
MTVQFGAWTLGLDGGEAPSRELIGGKAWSVARMQTLGLTVPPAFVVTTRACAAYLSGAALPDGLEEEISAGIAWLEIRTQRRFGHGPRPLLVSVRSGAPISMPGMMDTVLNLGINDVTEAALAAECDDPQFARDTHRRFLDLYGHIVLKTGDLGLAVGEDPARWRAAIAGVVGAPAPEDATEQLRGAVRAVFESWNSRRARRYRQHHGIPDTLGTAVTVQAMVFGNVDDRSGTGVLFSRNPLSGEPTPYGEYLPRAQGEDVVSGKFTPKPLSTLRVSMPEVHQALLAAARKLEEAGRDVQDIEFTIERGRLYLLQSRGAKLAPHAAVRIAVDLVREGLIDEAGALQRVTPDQVRILLSPHLNENTIAAAKVLAAGEGASPGVGIGVVVRDSDEAERRAHAGEAVILARPTTSPDDLHGMIAARAVVTEHGGSTSHAAVVGRALGLPCVVGCGAGSLAALTGKTITVDGRSGKVFEGALSIEAPDENDNELLATLAEWAVPRARLKVVAPSAAGALDAIDLSGLDAAADPARIGEALIAFKGAKGARGGAIASDEGVRAAIAVGLEFIVADPVLPPLLAAARIAAETDLNATEKELP